MMSALNSAVLGMTAQQASLDTIANNIANSNTTGFKKGRVEFEDTLYHTMKQPGGAAGVNQTPVGVQVGTGVKVAAQYAVFDQGSLNMTNGMFDMMINGDGFFAVQKPDGTTAYSRNGAFKVDRNHILVNSAGYPLQPTVTIPEGSQGVTITPTGEVRVINAQGQETKVGDISLTTFINPSSLMAQGGSLYAYTVAAGEPKITLPGTDGAGTIQQGALETSNVNAVEEMTNMIKTQRAFEFNSKSIQSADAMLQNVNTLMK